MQTWRSVCIISQYDTREGTHIEPGTVPVSQATCRSAARGAAAASYTLPPDAREKLVQIAQLVGDVIEVVMRGRDSREEAPARQPQPRRRGSRTPYVPSQPPSDIDRAKARRLLASKGLTEVAR